MNPPTDIKLPFPKIKQKGKTNNLTLNIYRNAYYKDVCKAKKEYQAFLVLKLRPMRKARYNKIRIIYIMYSKTKQKRDLANFCSIVDKFFQDALVSLKIISDDCQDIVQEVVFRKGDYCKEDYFRVIIEEVV